MCFIVLGQPGGTQPAESVETNELDTAVQWDRNLNGITDLELGVIELGKQEKKRKGRVIFSYFVPLANFLCFFRRLWATICCGVDRNDSDKCQSDVAHTNAKQVLDSVCLSLSIYLHFCLIHSTYPFPSLANSHFTCVSGKNAFITLQVECRVGHLTLNATLKPLPMVKLWQKLWPKLRLKPMLMWPWTRAGSFDGSGGVEMVGIHGGDCMCGGCLKVCNTFARQYFPATVELL